MTQAYTQSTAITYGSYDPTSNQKQHTNNNHNNTSSTIDISHTTNESKSQASGGARSRGSAVLQRAREYNRIIDQNKSKSTTGSAELKSSGSGSTVEDSDLRQRQSQFRSSGNDGGECKSSSHRRDKSLASAQSPPLSVTKSSGGRSQHGKSNAGRNEVGLNTSERDVNASPTTTNSSSDKENQNYRSSSAKDRQQQHQPQQEAIVTPELLVDALSGHEDGLLAIAERLMEHYDSGYDVMGEAIIDAFADVQKLFQHVVEAAHMEGAAYEAGRKEEEIAQLKQALEDGGENRNRGGEHDGAAFFAGMVDSSSPKNGSPSSGPMRHDEFIDQDVRDVLNEAIRKGQSLKEANQHVECYHIYEQACNSSSALLPVDSDHRGRLQLSIARAESMNPERACAILKYVMDDVLRSGLNANSKVVMPDPSKRGDCVLERPTPMSRGGDDYTGGGGSPRSNNSILATEEGVVLQSNEEALASIVEEMKEIVGAPVYDDSPLQGVANRFWQALSDAQKVSMKNEELLEQKLGTLKGDFLLAREEWEDKYNALSREHNNMKRRLENTQHSEYIQQAKQGIATIGKDNSHYTDSEFTDAVDSSIEDSPPRNRPGSSAGSFASLSQHAKSFVGSFSCTGGNSQSMSNREVRERKGLRGKGMRLQNDASPPSPSIAGTSGTSSGKKIISNEFTSPHRKEANRNIRRGPRTDF